MQKRYYKFKLKEPTNRKGTNLEKTLNQFKSCVNNWLNLLKSVNGASQKKLHQKGYDDMRQKYGLYSATVQEAMNRALFTWKANGKSKYQEDSMSFKGQSVKKDNDAINLPLVDGRDWFPFIVPDKFEKYLNKEHGNIVVKKSEENWFTYISYKIECQEEYEPKNYLGVDIGIINIATTSTAEGGLQKVYGGNQLLKRRKEIEEKKSRLQAKKGKNSNAYRALKRLSGKETNFSHNLNHKISKEIVQIAKDNKLGIALENISGITSNLDKETKKAKKMLKKWRFRDLIEKIEYKAEEKGVPIEKIDPRNTTKTCSSCGVKGELNDRRFKCKNCGLEMDRDLNASINIAKRGKNG